jgi:hypothetical protein
MAGVGRWRTTAAITGVVSVLISWASTLAGVTSPSAQARPAHTDQPSHLIVVVEENHAFEQVIGSKAAPFLNRLAAHGTLLTDYHAITHPSLPNYLALLSGRTGRIRSDCVHCTISAPP